MDIVEFEIENASGIIWNSLTDPERPKYDSYGNEISFIMRVSTSGAITNNFYFDAACFLSVPSGSSVEHPRYGSTPMAFVVDVNGMIDTETRSFNFIGNDNSNIIGSATLTRNNVNEYVVKHTFVLGKDVNDWMHKDTLTELDNSDAFTSYGDVLSVYETSKTYGVYLHASTEQLSRGFPISFNEFDKTNYGTPQFDINGYRVYQSAVESDTLSSDVDNEIRVYFTDTYSDFDTLSLVMLEKPTDFENLPREVAYNAKSYYGTTTGTDGYGDYASLTIPFADVQAEKVYTLNTTLLGTSHKTTSKRDLEQVIARRGFTECIPFIDVKWKSYLNTKESSKIDVAPYERMALEVHVWHNKRPTTIGDGYYDCLSDQGFWIPTFERVFKSASIDWFDGRNITFTRQSSTNFVTNTTDSEYELTSVSGHDVSIFRIYFRTTEDYINILHSMNFIMNVKLTEIYVNPNTQIAEEVVVIDQYITQPLAVRAFNWQNDLPMPDITDMYLQDSNSDDIINGVCDNSSYIEVISESATNYKAQALLLYGGTTQEQEDFSSVQTEPFFNIRTTNNIYDLEEDYSTSGDNKFKTNLGLNADKIIVIGCQA